MSEGLSAARPSIAAGTLQERVEVLRRTRPEAAWEVLEREFTGALRGADATKRGELWRVRGHVLRSLQKLRPAARAYRRAQAWFERAGDSREVGRCAIGLLDALMYLGRYREAERVAARGRRALARVGDWAAQARLLNNEGNLYHRLDRPDRALERYRRAHRALGRARDRQGQALVEGNMANCLSVLGRTGEARRLYQTARRVHVRGRFAVHALRVEYNLAYLDFLEHRHERALDRLERVREQADDGGMPSLAALSALDRSEILLRLGDHAGALEEVSVAAGAFARLSMTYEHAKAETFAALAEFRLGRPMAARARLERALAAFLEEGNAVWVGEVLIGLATAWWRDGSPATAVPLLAAAARRFAGARDREREGCALALLARVRLEAGRRGVGKALERARRLSREGRRVWLRHLTWVASAEQARRRGDRAAARRHLERAAGESERLAARILDEQWRASFWGEWGWPHLELAALEMEAGRAEAAFEALERGRGRALASPWKRRRGADADSLRAWVAARLARDRERITRSAELRPADARLSVPQAGVWRALRSRVGPAAIRARELRAALPEDALLLDYTLHRDTLAAFALGRERLTMAPSLVKAGELVRLVHEVLFELRRVTRAPQEAPASAAALAATLEEIASLLLWPVLERGGRVPRTLIVLPAGPLARLPWAALPLPAGAPLCEVMELVLVPGLRLGLGSRSIRAGHGRPLIVASGAEGLESVAAEAEAVSRALPDALILTGESATADRFLEHVPRAPWIHFAGHGIFQAGRSGLRFHDRWLLAEELEEVRLSARGVTLSACQTARALVGPGEEWFGLARTLLLGGAEAVLAAQWDVNDVRAAAFMADLYARLGEGASLAEAVARTQSAMFRAGHHPLDWAGYVVLGGPAAGSARALNGSDSVKRSVVGS